MKEYIMRPILLLRCLAFAVVIGFGSTASAGASLAIRPYVAEVKSSSPTEFEITYEWWVGSTPTVDQIVYVHFTDLDGKIKFKEEFEPDPATSKWPKGKEKERVKLASRKVKIPEGLTGPFDIRMGTRSKEYKINDAIFGPSDNLFRVKVGQIKVEGGKVVFEDLISR
jgi:hypothetical protein